QQSAQQPSGEQRAEQRPALGERNAGEIEVEGDRLIVERAEYGARACEHKHQQDQSEAHASGGPVGLSLWPASTLATKGQACAVARLSTIAFTRSRNSLPGLKCGTCLPGSATAEPVFGLRPMRGGR